MRLVSGKRVAIIALMALTIGLTATQSVLAGDMLARITAPQGVKHMHEQAHEALLMNALRHIEANEIDSALEDLEALVKVNPDFKLAQLMYADLLLARAGPITDFGQPGFAGDQRIEDLRAEALARWRHFNLPPENGKVPSALLQLSPNQRHVIVVDQKASRLYLYENRDGVAKLLDSFYVSIGKNGIGKEVEGDQRTPVGVYFITDFIDPAELPDLYGNGAFPIDYPNPWDQRHQRTGYGIWLHGTFSNTYSRPPLDSDGCVTLSNSDLDRLGGFIDIGITPVVLTESIDWIAREDLQQKRQQFAALLEQWRTDWESRDADAYLRHYSKSYSGLGMEYPQWVEYKSRVNPSKSYINVDISNTSIFQYPGASDVVVMNFEQDYDSDNYQRMFRKRQFWQREADGKWRIIYEGNISY